MWIVLWLVISTTPVECPDFKPDPYTGKYPSTHCLVYHCKKTTQLMTKEFMDSKGAKEYIDAAPDGMKSKMKLVHLEVAEDNSNLNLSF